MHNNQKIPEGWSVKKLGDICLLTSGGTPSKATISYWKNGDIKWLSAKHIEDDKIVGCEYITKEAVDNSASKLTKKGDIILVTRVSVGKIILCEEEFAVNQDLTIISSKQDLPNFLFYSLKNKTQIIVNKSQGLAIKGITKDELKELNLLLPPLPEQEKIAEILGTWDEAIEKLTSLIEQKKLLKKGLMQKLLTGKVRLFKTSPLAGEVADLSAGEGLDNQQSESIQNKKITNTLAYRQDCPLTSPLAGKVADLSAGEGLDNNDNIKISSHRMYQPYIKEFSRDMRKNSTKAENLLWQKIRNGQLGFKFRRQHQIDNKYIADFICLEKRLIIELDGGQHNDRSKDKDRTLYLENNNFKVIRFWDNEILQNIDGCLEILLKEISLLNNPSPCPSPARGEGISATYSNSLPQGARKDAECYLDTPHQAQKCHPLPQGARKNERFSQPWKEVKLGDFLKEHTEKTTENDQYQVLSVTKNGICSQEEYFEKQIASENNIGYKILRKHDIVFSPMNLWMGSIGFSEYDIGIVSPAYKIFSVNENVALFSFLKHFMIINRMIYLYLINSEQGASIVRRNLDLDGLLSSKVSIPDITEQQAIANVLSTADDEIDLLNKKLILFKEQKKGLMQQLLTGNIRVKV